MLLQDDDHGVDGDIRYCPLYDDDNHDDDDNDDDDDCVIGSPSLRWIVADTDGPI